VIEVDAPVRSQPVLDFFTGDQITGPLEQQTEQIECLSAEPQRLSSSAEASSAIVELEGSECLQHGGTPS